MLVELLGEHHGSIPAAAFYDRLCAAACRLTRLRRATLLLYDEAYQAVRAVGAHRVEPAVVEHLEGTLNETPVAQRALEDDDVIVISGDLSQHVLDRLRDAWMRLACDGFAFTTCATRSDRGWRRLAFRGEPCRNGWGTATSRRP